jgi:hypothetical protein
VIAAASGGTYSISLAFANGGVAGPFNAHLRTPSATTAAGTGALPVFSASDSRVYFLDGNSSIRFLGPDGSHGQASLVPGGPAVQSAFAVSPDDHRIAVAALDPSTGTKLYVEDLAGGNRINLPLPSHPAVWPVGWHSGLIVLAEASPATQTQPANPYGTFAGYMLLDPNTGVRWGSLECNPAGPLTPAGTACLGASGPLVEQDFAGRQHAAAPAAGVETAAEAPDGARLALCCPSGLLELWTGSGDLVSLGAASADGYGWIDATHLLISGLPGSRARIADVVTGKSSPTSAAGKVVGRVPGGL